MQNLRTVFILGVFAATQASAQLRDGLVSYWPLNAIETDHTPDVVSGNHLYLYNMGETDIIPGRYGSAFSFDGISQFLALSYGSNPKLPLIRARNYTVAFWVKGPARQENAAIFAEGFTLTDQPLFMLGTHPKGESPGLNVFLRSNDQIQLDNVSAETVVLDNNWHHVAWVDENGEGRLYVDGRLDVTSFIYQRRPVRLNDLSIGALFRETPSGFFRGLVDDVALWERALTKNEITQVMNGGLTAIFGDGKQAN